MNKIKVMTFNLRVEVFEDGNNSFSNRKDRVLSVIKDHNPDIIGFQEATESMKKWLNVVLNDYIVVGCGRDKHYGGESTPIAYKKDKFDLIELTNFWLSNTPSVPASTYGLDQSGCPRIVTSTILRNKDTNKRFLYINTHLDHVGRQARLLSSKQLINFIKEKEIPCVLTGDFNALPNSPEIKEITNYLNDLTVNIKGTFHEFGKLDKPTKIDYIFTNLNADIQETYIIGEKPIDGVYVSDHHQICGYFEI